MSGRRDKTALALRRKRLAELLRLEGVSRHQRGAYRRFVGQKWARAGVRLDRVE